jgi:DNA (cytosine-5)-methyltransferase 1
LHDIAGALAAESGMKQQTYVAEPAIALEGNGARPSHRGSGVGESGVSFTLNATENHAVCYQERVGALCASDYKFPQSQQIDEGKAVVERVVAENYQHANYREVDTAGTLKASGGSCADGETRLRTQDEEFSHYVVRRLVPTECSRLQGFPDWWCDDLGTPNPSEDDLAFWTEVFATQAAINGTKPRSRAQIVKWLQNPHSDAAEYKMWGNGVALPVVAFVLGGVAEVANEVD